MIEILYCDGCPHHGGLETRIKSLLIELGMDAPVVTRRIESDDQAAAENFLGSPTLRVNGLDVDPTAPTGRSSGLTCRLYLTDDGLRGTPPDAWIIADFEGIR